MTASKIEWTGRSDWNPVRGCTRASEGCRHCYAEQIAGRFSDLGQAFHGFATRTKAGGRWTGRVELREDRLTLPLRWRKPATVFVNSTSDIFHESLPDEAIDRIFAVMALAPQHTFQVLTKRAERMRGYVSSLWLRGDMLYDAVRRMGRTADEGRAAKVALRSPLPNVWLGVSVEDQSAADGRIPHLLATPAALRFLSCEPLIGPVDLTCLTVGDREMDALNPYTWDAEIAQWQESVDPPHDWRDDFEDEYGRGPEGLTGPMHPTVDWVIAGGESGRGARPMHPDWLIAIRDQCEAAGVPFFLKQWGEWAPVSEIDVDALYDDLYHPAPAGDPEATRRSRVAQCVLHRDGLRFEHREWQKVVNGDRVLAFQAGHHAMTMMQLGKRRTGHKLAGREHLAMPA